MQEYHRWGEYETIEPFGNYWIIQQNSLLVARVMNATKNKNGRTLKPSDFLPKGPKETAKMTPDQIKGMLIESTRTGDR